MSEQIRTITLRNIKEVWSKGDMDLVDEIYDANYVYHEPVSGEIHGRDGIRQLIMMWRTAMPDLEFTNHDMIVEGDKGAQRWTAVGTHQSEVMGIPATGKRITVAGINIVRYANGKAVEEWTYWDALGWLQQLGVVPPLGGGNG